MGLDNFTKVIYGWKIEGSKNVEKANKAIKKVIGGNDIYDVLDGCFIDDSMCGEYFYFGALIGSYDANGGGEIIVNQEAVDQAIKQYNNLTNEQPKLLKVFRNIIKKYTTNKEPQLYVMQNIW